MRTKIRILALDAFAFGTFAVKAQSTTQSSDFSLQSAIDYAIKHNATFLNSELDVKMARY